MDEPTCTGCRELLKRVAELEARLRDLEARLGLNASNSSMPPSANPPQAPPPVRKQPTGRKPGGQPGHTAHVRVRLPPERLTEPTVHYWPATCAACQHALPPAPGPDDPEPRWHQVVELPAIPVQVTE
jgi:transposase